VFGRGQTTHRGGGRSRSQPAGHILDVFKRLTGTSAICDYVGDTYVAGDRSKGPLCCRGIARAPEGVEHAPAGGRSRRAASVVARVTADSRPKSVERVGRVTMRDDSNKKVTLLPTRRHGWDQVTGSRGRRSDSDNGYGHQLIPISEITGRNGWLPSARAHQRPAHGVYQAYQPSTSYYLVPSRYRHDALLRAAIKRTWRSS